MIAMVGLPGRGKSFISSRLCRWLNWKGIPTTRCNAGHYRRKLLLEREENKERENKTEALRNSPPVFHASSVFDPENMEGVAMRERMVEWACNDLVAFLTQNPGGVGILDATNTTRERREWLLHYFEPFPIEVLFVESVCDDKALIRRNILRTKCGNEDYRTTEPGVVLHDFKDRIRQYEKVYQTLSPSHEDALSYIKMVNVKTRVELHRIQGYLPTCIVHFLLNLHLSDHTVFLTRSGWSAKGEEGVLGHDGDLSPRGLRYALALKRFIDARVKKLARASTGVGEDECTDVPQEASPVSNAENENSGSHSGHGAGETYPTTKIHSPTPFHVAKLHTSPYPEVTVLCSPLRRAVQTSLVFQQDVRYLVREYPSLTELHYGDFHGRTARELDPASASVLSRIRQDPYHCRYPRGEGYKALAKRLDPIFMELQHMERPTLVVSHSAVLQVLRAFLADESPETAHQTSMPLGAVLEVTPHKNQWITSTHDIRPLMEEITEEELERFQQKAEGGSVGDEFQE